MEHGGEQEALWSAGCSPSSSSTSLQDAGDEPDEVFVAVVEEINDGESILLWALHNLAKYGSKIVIAHVRSPAQLTHENHHTSLKAEKNLHEYELVAKRTRNDLQIDCERVIIEKDDVAEGLEELIVLHGITKLVMGAAADQHYTEEMRMPKSKTALKLMETAAPLCKIWFTCNGHLICTREANENLPAISLPSAKGSKTSLSVCSISSQMKSMDLKSEVPSSKGCSSGSLVESAMSDWDFFFGDWGRTVYDDSSRIDDAVSISAARDLPVVIGDANRQRLGKHSPTHESDDEEPSLDANMYDKFNEAWTEAELLKEEADEESNKRRKAEMDLLTALQRVKESENSYLHEVNQRKETEKTLARQRLEIDEMRRRRHALFDELQDTKKQKLVLEQRVTQTESAAKDYAQDINDYFIKESCEESKKHRKIEMDLILALQIVKEVECLYLNEKTQRKDMEGKIARQRMEIEETKQQRDELYYELRDVKEDKLRLERADMSEETDRRRKAERDLLSALQRVKDMDHRRLHEMKKQAAAEEILAQQKEQIQETKREIDEMHVEHMTQTKSTVQFYEEKLAESKHFIQELQAKYNKVLKDRDTAIDEAKEVRQKNFMTVKNLNTDFSFSELQRATEGFDTALKIGEGRFGSVYKGFLRNTSVAIEILHPQSLQGQSEVHQEVADLSRVRHPNLMMLIGACPEAVGLVYEFLPNGSLEDQLSQKKNTPTLTWQVRTRIIGEICSVLTFIHSNNPHPIVHGDLNPDNILLDTNFVSKLRVCRLLKQCNTIKNSRGTSSYMDPELLSTGELTPQSDVYSFGIIILRLLTGRPPQKIMAIVETAMEKKQLHSIIDVSAGSWPFVQASQLAHLGLRCASLNGRHRPDLAGEAWGVIKPLMKIASLNSERIPFAAPSDDTHTPSYFVCPIFQEVMVDPHMAADGFTYEAEAIRGWLASGHDTSPMTNLRLAHCDLTPNRALRSAILGYGR